jgi:hypothetical protein
VQWSDGVAERFRRHEVRAETTLVAQYERDVVTAAVEGRRLVVRGGTQERNDLRIARDADGVRVEDAAHQLMLRATPACSLAERVVRCDPALVDAVHIEAGDEDDA